MTNDKTYSEIKQKISSLEKEGFMYLQEWSMSFHAPDRLQLPSGTILDEEELCQFFKKTKPKFGDIEHVEIIKALEYYKLINSEKYDEDRHSYTSFIDGSDELNCMRKYQWKAKVSLF